jgi:hypothetical protein
MACLGLVEQAPSEHSRRLAAIIHRADKCKDASPWLASRWPLVVRPRLCTIHDVNVSASTVKGPRGHSPSPSASGKENGERRRRSREGISIVSICQMAHSKFGSLSIWQIGTRAASAVRPQAPANPGGRRVSEIQKLGHSLSTCILQQPSCTVVGGIAHLLPPPRGLLN